MIHSVSSPSIPTSSALRGGHALQRLPRSTVEREIGFLTYAREIRDGHTATLLQPLSGDGGLYLTHHGLLAEVRPTTDAQMLRVRCFRGSPSSMWEDVAEHLPDVQVGRSMPRFWIAQESSAGVGKVIYSVLDVLALDVLERGSDRDEIAVRVTDANADPEGYLERIRWDRTREAVLAALHQHAGVG